MSNRSLTERTYSDLMRLIRARPGGHVRNAGGGEPQLQMVRCTSAAAVGGSPVLDECYPAVVVSPASDTTLPPEEAFPCLLTLVGLDGAAVPPVAGGVYLCFVSGDAADDASGSRAGRARAFGVVASESGGGLEWMAALEAGDCLRLTLEYTPPDEDGSGSGGGEPATAEVSLASTDGDTWTGPPVTIGGMAYTPTLTREDCNGPCLTLASALRTAAGVRGGAGCSFVNFGFSRAGFFPCEPKLAGGPCANLIRARVEWVPCRTQGWVSGCCDTGSGSGFDPTAGGVPRYMCVEWIGAGDPPFLPRTFDVGNGEGAATPGEQWGRNLVHTIGGTSYVHSILLGCDSGYWTIAFPVSSFGASLFGRSAVTVAETCALGEDFEVVLYQGEDGSGPAIWRVRAWTEAGCAQPSTLAGWEGEGWYCVDAECDPLAGWDGEGWYCVEDATGSGSGDGSGGGPGSGDDEGPIEGEG